MAIMTTIEANSNVLIAVTMAIIITLTISIMLTVNVVPSIR